MRRSFPAFPLVVALLAAALGHVGFTGLDQNVRAARGEGAPGVFTATVLSCVQHPGHESCTCAGTFRSGEEPERQVYLHAAGPETCVEGSGTRARDVGAQNRVYGPDGSREWVLSVLMLVVSGALVCGAGFRVFRAVRT